MVCGTVESCVICQRRIPRVPNACDACRNRVANTLKDIRDMYAELLNVNAPLPGKDHISLVMPVGNTLPKPIGGRVTGTRENTAPVSLTSVDLTGRVRPRGALTASGGRRWPDGNTVDGTDQVGVLSVSTMLDSWVRLWRMRRSRGERLPAPTVPVLCGWLLARWDEECDGSDGVAQFADDLGHMWGVLRCVLGLTPQEPEVERFRGIPCRAIGCEKADLLRRPLSDWVECGSCGHLMSPEEYDKWVVRLAAWHKNKKKQEETATTT